MIFSVFELHYSAFFWELFKKGKTDGIYDIVVHLNARISSRIDTRTASQGLLNQPLMRTKNQELTFSNKLIKAVNILQSIKIWPAYLKNLTKPALKNIYKNFNVTYVFDNADIFDLFALRKGPRYKFLCQGFFVTSLEEK